MAARIRSSPQSSSCRSSSGANVGNFHDVYEALAAANAAITVDDDAALAEAVKSLIENPGERDRLAREARACVERFGGALERTLTALKPYLASLAHSDEAPARA